MRKIYILDIKELHSTARQEIIFAGLNLQRREKALRYKREEDRVRSMAAGALLQYGIWCWQQEQPARQDSGVGCIWENVCWEQLAECFTGGVSSLKVIEGSHGKPYLEGLSVHFNLSHSGQIVICGISDQEIGVDVQMQEGTDHEKLWNRYFSEQDKGQLNGCQSQEEQEAMFYRLWAQKEAYGKLTGEGLAGKRGLKVSPLQEKISLGIDVEEYTPAPGYYAAVCWYSR